MSPCKLSGRRQFRHWHHGSPGSGTRSDTSKRPPSQSALQGQHHFLFCLAPQWPAMTHFLTCHLNFPIAPAFRSLRKQRAAFCGSCVNPTRPFGPIALDAWSFQGEWPMSALNSIAWPCKRPPPALIDDFYNVRRNRGAFTQRYGSGLSARISTLGVRKKTLKQPIRRARR